jgi:hypothetical protein
MSDPEILKELLEQAKREVERWPESMKNQEPIRLLSVNQQMCDDRDEDEQLARCG